MPTLFSVALLGVLTVPCSVCAITLDVTSVDSITSAAQTIVSGIMTRYSNSSEMPGLFPAPYYWWESGLAWDSIVNYWSLTGDATYNDLVGEALLFQVGSNNQYEPANQTTSEGNDDQSTWALAAMTAAERGFPLPPGQNSTSWVQLAQNVFDSQVARWDTSSCGGGLRWQIFTFNNGYNYKNALANGNFAQLGARLALYTGNSTYSDWAGNVTQWSLDSGLISDTGAIWDGASTTTNCSQFNHLQWTASAGTYLSALAYSSNESSTLYWAGNTFTLYNNANRTFALYSNANQTFAPNGTLIEIACQSSGTCNTDQFAYRAILARALANTRDLTRDFELIAANSSIDSANCTTNIANPGRGCNSNDTLHQDINRLLLASAKGAAAQCSGGSNGTACGADWSSSTWDGTQGLGQDLSALEIILANLPAQALRNANTTGDVIAGSGSNGTTSSSTSSSGSASAPANTNAAVTSSASTFALMSVLGFVAAFFL